MKEKIKTLLRWVVLLPASALGSFLVYLIFYWMNKEKHEFTNGDSLWNYLVMFISHLLMGASFILIGVYVAPSNKKVCACVLFGMACVLAGISLAGNIVSGFSYVSLISMICMLIGSGYAFYVAITGEQANKNNPS